MTPLCQPEAVEAIQIAAFTQLARTERAIGCATFTPNTHQFYKLMRIVKDCNWHVRDDYMMGISEIASSKEYIPLKVHTWYHKPFEHVCSNCFKVIYQFAKTENRPCEQCNKLGLPTLANKLSGKSGEGNTRDSSTLTDSIDQHASSSI
ncbi:hypothetical protein DAPPUDRAFT_323452 [Daphnia pulex]|uniref:Uncharacterized protein n=1 Tax=Daphnia pulex TaxID=6669 RepID=E9GYW3_DAPPU|nr:hypothetical protein DAPPUDRAFT_323452 [Daphnia pulex]|eukprot:EFX75338.1 hypothetical protein DAPPUDRAFT_323452 [Daphnia pulex]